MTKQEAEVILKVNSKEAEDKLNKLEHKAEELRKDFEEALKVGDEKAINRITRELNRTNTEIQGMRTNAANVRAAMERLDKASPKDLRKTISLITKELHSGRVQRGTKEWETYVAALKQVKDELRKVESEMTTTTEKTGGFVDKIKGWQATIVGAFTAVVNFISGIKSKISEYVDAYVGIEGEMANVRKYTGMTAEEVDTLNNAFKEMDTRTTAEGLNQLAQEAGRLGKQSVEDVLGFVKAADQINVALDDLGEGATLTLSKLTSIFGDEERLGTEKSLLAVGSVINELSQNCAASAPYIAEFASRLGGVGAQAGMSVQQIMAYAAVLDTAGVNVEASSTALQQFMVRVYRDPSKYAKAAGLDVKKFADLVKTDLNSAMLQLLDTVSKAGGMDVLAPMFAEMGENGSNAVKTLSILSGKIAEVRSQQEVANQAFDEASSITAEFNVQNSTAAAELDKAKNRAHLMAAALGEQLYPVMRYCVDASTLMIQGLSTMVNFAIKYRSSILSVAAGVAAYTLAVNASNIALKAQQMWMAASNVTAGAFRSVMLLVSAAVSACTGNIGRASAAMRLFNATVKANPIGLLIGLLTTAVSAFMAYRANAEESAKAQKEINNAINQTNAQLHTEQTEIDKAFSALRRAKEGTKEYEDAKNNIISQYGQYLTGLVNERNQLINVEAAYLRVSAAARDAALARGMADAKKTVDDKFVQTDAELMGKVEEKLKKYLKNQDDLAAIMQLVRNDLPRLGDISTKTEDIIRAAIKKGGKENSWEVIYSAIREVGANYEKYDSDIKDVETRFGYSVNEFMDYTKEELEMMYDDLNNQMLDKSTKTFEVISKGMRVKEYQTKAQAANALVQIENALKAASAGATTTSSTDNNDTTDTGIPIIKGETDEERKAREKAQREAAKQEKEALKKDLAEQKAERDKALAEQLALYSTGTINYIQNEDAKYQIECDYLDRLLDVYKSHGMEESSEYASTLRKKEELVANHEASLTKLSLREIEERHRLEVDNITAAYFDSANEMYQNEKAYNQALLEETVYYLREKQKLYIQDSDEWYEIEQEVNEAVAQDQLRKQRETFEAMSQFEEQYRKASGSLRQKQELAILEELHKAKFISEEEYLKAREAIIKKFENKDKEKIQRVKSEYADLVVNIYDSFKKLFDNLGKKGNDFWSNLSDAAAASFAVMGAVMSQYSAYVNAERDVELAKIESRYDREITAAGKNQKKVAKLEEQKSAEIAKTKKKYNDRAMKIEIAQAIAQTASAAIAAYASAAAIPVTGWIMAPIAAALATAAGMVQIATIKKQHEAEAAGYYEGGFTSRDADDRKPTGIVHANEFVFSSRAVRNPALSPLLNLVDRAQRNNTVASLTRADVSAALGYGQVPGLAGTPNGAASGAATVINNTINVDAINRLNDLLERGIDARAVISGENGVARKLEIYNKLNSNPKR